MERRGEPTACGRAGPVAQSRRLGAAAADGLVRPVDTTLNLKRAFVGEWRITATELWDLEDLDLVTQATLSFEGNGGGQFTLIAIEARLDYRVVTRDGRPGIEFSFHGFHEGDGVMGRGWAVLKGDDLEGRLFFHQGDESSFLARRKPTKSPAAGRLGPTDREREPRPRRGHLRR